MIGLEILFVAWLTFQVSPLELAIRKQNQILDKGVGIGLIQDRPRQCVPMTAYWATNQLILYRCTDGKGKHVWEPYYTPFPRVIR